MQKLKDWVGPTNSRLLLILGAMMLGLGLAEGDKLFGAAGLRSMAFQLPELGFLALAMMIPMLSGGIDLSIIAIANLCALAMAYLLTTWMPEVQGAVAVWLVLGIFLVGLLLSILVGLLNGVLIAHFRVHPMLATLGTMTAVKGIAIGLSHGNVISGFPEAVVFIGHGSLWGVPVALLVFCLVFVPLGMFLKRTPLGTTIALIGSNERAAHFSGVNTKRSLMWVYLISAVLSFMAGAIMMARFDSANAAYGESYLLTAILAAVLGGVNPMGGFGKVGGVIVSLLILQLMSTASILLDLSQFITLAIWGVILILASGGAVWKEWIVARMATRAYAHKH